MIGREYKVEVRAGGRVSVRSFRAVSRPHAIAQAIDAFPVEVACEGLHITSLITCTRCLGGPSGELDPDCPRCHGIGTPRWGNDPVSYDGCLPDCDLDHPAGEHCSTPIGAG